MARTRDSVANVAVLASSNARASRRTQTEPMAASHSRKALSSPGIAFVSEVGTCDVAPSTPASGDPGGVSPSRECITGLCLWCAHSPRRDDGDIRELPLEQFDQPRVFRGRSPGIELEQ